MGDRQRADVHPVGILGALALLLGSAPATWAQRAVEIKQFNLSFAEFAVVTDTVHGMQLVAAPSLDTRLGDSTSAIAFLYFEPDTVVAWLESVSAYLTDGQTVGANLPAVRWAPPLRGRGREGELSIGRKTDPSRPQGEHYVTVRNRLSSWTLELTQVALDRLLGLILDAAMGSQLIESRDPSAFAVSVPPDSVVHTFKPARFRDPGIYQYPNSEHDGRVIAQFVVSADGKVDMESLRILLASDRVFANEARRIIKDLNVEPARYGDRPVSMLTLYTLRFHRYK